MRHLRGRGNHSQMTNKPKPQVERFRDLARELECDNDEAAFKAKLRKVATALRPPKAKESLPRK